MSAENHMRRPEFENRLNSARFVHSLAASRALLAMPYDAFYSERERTLLSELPNSGDASHLKQKT